MAVRLDILFTARGNMAQLDASLQGVKQRMAGYAAQAKKVGASNAALVATVNDYERSMASAIDQTGRWQTMSTRVVNPMTQMTKALQKQEITWRSLGGVIRNHRALAMEQMKTHQMDFAQFRRDAAGNLYGQRLVPQELSRNLSTTGMSARIMNEAIASSADNMVKWGKNTQWAGRQLTVGLTLPIALAAKAMVNLATEVDKQLTSIVKVYDFVGTEAGRSMESVKEQSLATADAMAKNFGILPAASLEVVRMFASMGYVGDELQKMTRESLRFATLGEIEHAKSTELVANTMAAWGMEIEEVTVSLNKFNQVENNTRLTMDEIAATLPRFSAILNTLGMAPEIGVAMVAGMKQFGVEANRAATSLNFGLNSLFGRKTNVARETWLKWFGEAGPAIDEMFDIENAEESLYRFADALSSLDANGQIEILNTLVEKRRTNDFLNLFKAIKSGNRDVGDFGKAMEAAGMTATEAAESANTEMQRLLNSNAKRLEIAKATLQSQFADLGRILLPPLVSLMEFLGKMVKAFEGLSSQTKVWIGRILGVAAIVGPITMLIGLLANLFGQGIKVFTSLFTGILNVGKVLKLTTQEQREAAIAAEMATQQINEQAAAYRNLAGAAQSAAFAQNSTPVGRYNLPIVARQDTAGPQAAALAQQHATAAKGRMVGVVGGAAVAAAMMTTMVTDSDSIANNIAKWVFGLGMVVPMISQIASLMRNTKVGIAVGNIVGSTKGMFGKLLAPAAGIGKAMGALLFNPVTAAIAAVAAAIGGAVWLLNRYIKKIKEMNVTASEGAKQAAETMGLAWEEGAAAVDNAGNVIETTAAAAAKFREENSKLVEHFKSLDRAEQAEYVFQYSYELQRRGNSPEDAHKAAQRLMDAAGVIGLKAEVYHETAQIQRQAQIIGNQMRSAMESESRGRWERIGNWFGLGEGGAFGKGAIGAKEEELAIQWGESLGLAVQSGIKKAADSEFDAISSGFKEQYERLAEEIRKDESMMYYVNEAGMGGSNEDIISHVLGKGAYASSAKETMDAIEKVRTAEELAMKTFIESQGLLVENYDLTKGWMNLRSQMAAETGDIGELERQALQEYQINLGQAARMNKELSETEKERMAVELATRYGVDVAIFGLEKYGEVTDDATESVRKLTDAERERINELTGKIRSTMQDQISQITNATVAAFDAETSIREEKFSEELDASSDHYDDLLDKADEYWSNRIEKTDKAYDRQIDAVEDSAKAEVDAIKDQQKAAEELEQRRQEIFDRHKARMSYLTNQSNQNLRMRFALMEGDHQQAAILRNEIRAAEYDFTLDEATAGHDRTARGRKAAADEKIDAINAEADAEKDRLKEEQEAARKSLEAKKKMRQEELKAAQESARDQIETRQKQFKAERDLMKQNLERELELWASFTPKNARQMRLRTAKLNTIVESYGVTVENVSREYGGKVGDAWNIGIQKARNDLAEDRRWEQFGRKIADMVAQGTLGISRRDIMRFLATGELSNRAMKRLEGQWEISGPDGNRTARRSGGVPSGRVTERHTGGMAGYGPPNSGNNLRPDEVPTILQRGEYVMDKKTVGKFGSGFFRTLQSQARIKKIENDSMIPRFHSGGIVGEALLPAMAGMRGVLAQMIPQIMVQSATKHGNTRVLAALSKLGYGTGMGDIDAFMAAIRFFESGGDYNVTNPWGYHGAYQFGTALWNEWDKKTLGYDVDLYSANKNEQDAVARAAMQHYFDIYKDWGAVAAAWIGGPGGANAYLAGQTGASDQLGTSVAEYVNKIIGKMGEFQTDVGDVPGGGLVQLGRWLQGKGARVSSHPAFGGISWGSHSTNSLHYQGRAIDVNFAPGASPYERDMIARYLPAVMQKYGGRLVQNFHPANDPAGHDDHWHLAMHGGGLVGGVGGQRFVTPQLYKGAKVMYDNTLANLHKGETVLTRRVSNELERGIANMDRGGGNVYNVDVIIQGDINDRNRRALVRDVRLELQTMERHKSRQRVIK